MFGSVSGQFLRNVSTDVQYGLLFPFHLIGMCSNLKQLFCDVYKLDRICPE